MSTIDERVVSLKFNNGQFQSAVAATMDGLSKLKTSLNFDGAKTGLSDLGRAAGNVSMAGLISGVDTATQKFDTMKTVGLAALATVAAKATSAGIEMGKSFVNKAFIQAPKDGLAEYELKIGSIQTILANTSKHGTTLKQVTKNLDELNTYSDKTIYNFGDMTRNIGLFTNAGIKIEDATSMIKGFSNEAATSGTTAANASGAAYQLSQALSAGKITLMDWKSLTNVGMGSANMKDGIIDIATAMGTFEGTTTSAQKAGKDFNGSLSEGWLTADVMQNYLQIQAGDLSDAQMKSIGLTGKQIEAFKKQAVIAQEAATKVRTLSQVFETYNEVVGSGWAQSWEIVFGDFEEATVLFTAVSDGLNSMATASTKARNDMLQGWKDLGGRTALIEGITNIFKGLMSVITPIKEAWAEVFPPSSVNVLYVLTNAFRNFTKLLILGDGQTNALKETFKFFFNILKIGVQIVGGILLVMGKLLEAIFTGGEGMEVYSDAISGFFKNINKALENTQWITSFFQILGSLAGKGVGALKDFGAAIFTAFANSAFVQNFGAALQGVGTFLSNFGKLASEALGAFVSGGLEAVFTRVRERLDSLAAVGDKISEVFQMLKGVFMSVVKAFEPLASALGKMFSDIGANISDVFTNVNFDTGLDILNTGLLAGLVLLIRNFFKNVLGMGDGVKEDLLGKLDGMVEGVKGALGGLTGTLEAMQTNLKADTLIKIAGAIALLTASVVVLSLIDSGALTKALVAMSTMFVQLGLTMKGFEAMALTMNMGTMVALGIVLMSLATAILILSFAVAVLAQLDWVQLAKGLVGVTVLLRSMAGAVKLMGPNVPTLVGAGLGMIAIAIAIKILASAVADFAELSFGNMVKGLVGVASALTALAIFTKMVKVQKGAIASSVGLILLGVALKIMASAMSDFAAMDMGQMTQGLITLTAVLVLLSEFSRATGKITNMMSMGIGLIFLGVAMNILATALDKMGSIPLPTLAKGLGAMAIALLSISAAMLFMPADMIARSAGLVAVALALNIMAPVIERFGSMDIASIGKALLVLAGSLGLIALAMNVMTTALPGAAALLVVSAALAIFTPVLMALGSMPWETIWTGLGALALVFVLLGVASLVLSPVVPIMLALGIAILTLGIGMQGVGLGMLTFAGGLAVLAAVGAAAVPVLVEIIKSMIDLLPYLIAKIGESIVLFTEVIIANIPVFVVAMTALISGLLTAIITLAPQIAMALWVVIQELLALLVNAVPAFVDAAFKIILGILRGIENNIYQIVEAGIQIVVKLLQGIADNIGDVVTAGADIIIQFLQGIQDNDQDVIQAGVDTVISFIDGVTSAITNNTDRLRASGEALGWAIADGMSGGLASKVKGLADSAAALGAKMIASAKAALDSNSPSKKFIQIGEDTGEGAIIGMNNKQAQVGKASENMGKSAIDGMKTAMSGLGSDLDGNMQVNPRITPVLDLSAIRKDSGLIGGMLGANSVDATLSGDRARSISESIKRSSNEESAKPKGDTILHFEQTNNSPKALSDIEIYRNTRNQLSLAKGALNI